VGLRPLAGDDLVDTAPARPVTQKKSLRAAEQDRPDVADHRRRPVDAAPHVHWQTTAFVAGLRSTGIIAPLVLDGPMTGDAFRAYVEQFLAPELSPGDVVVMDNLTAHKVAGVREAITAVGASVLYLPPYSPDLNPIEQMFAKLKALLRKAAARTRDALWDTIGHLLHAFSPAECRNYLENSGYVFG
jgi:transposase